MAEEYNNYNDSLLNSALSPARVTFPAASLSCRLSAEPTRRTEVHRNLTAWVSIQGRLVGAEEATSARVIKGGLSREDVAAWELFKPMERVILVATVAVAAKESKRERKIVQLQRSVDIRDELLLNMQKKLEELCLQINLKDPLTTMETETDYNAHKVCGESKDDMVAEKKEAEICSCGHANSQLSLSNWPKVNAAEQEERRMSDLSDFSCASSVDVQLSALAQEQDFYNLRMECEEKDATIKELAAVAHESSVAGSKRIIELEDIIRRKNMIITRLKKDMVVIEQKVIQLTRLQRPSNASRVESNKLPTLATNLLYDMSSSSSSSSDSDSPAEHKGNQTKSVVKSEAQFTALSLSCSPKQQSANPDKDSLTIHRGSSIGSSRQKRMVSSSREPKRRCTQQETNRGASQKRWS